MREGAILLLQDENGILGGREHSNGHAPGLLRLPSEKLKLGEKPLDTLLRGCREEIGKDFVPINPKLSGVVEWITPNYKNSGDRLSVLAHVYTARAHKGQLGTERVGSLENPQFLEPSQIEYHFHKLLLSLIKPGQFFHGSFVENEKLKISSLELKYNYPLKQDVQSFDSQPRQESIRPL